MYNLIVLLIFIVIVIWFVYRCFTFEVDFSELDKTTKTCPKCSEFLYVEIDSFVKVYRCKDCYFEGAKWNVPKKVLNKIPNYER